MNDNNSGVDFLEDINKNEDVENIVIDAGYTSPILLNEVLKSNKKIIIPYTKPKGSKKKNKDKIEPPLPSTSYKFDKQNNCYICKWEYHLHIEV